MNEAATADATGVIITGDKLRPGILLVARPSGSDIDVKQIRLASSDVGRPIAFLTRKNLLLSL
jgi:hypothetical protein